jgi:hypothetical protein
MVSKKKSPKELLMKKIFYIKFSTIMVWDKLPMVKHNNSEIELHKILKRLKTKLDKIAKNG